MILLLLGTSNRAVARLDVPKYLKIHPTVFISQLKPFIKISGVVSLILIINREELETNSVPSHRISGSKYDPEVHFQIMWKGDSINYWQECEDLEGCIESLKKYLLIQPYLTKESNHPHIL